MLTTIDKPELELSESDGNVFCIIGKARRVARKAGWTAEQIEEFQSEVTSGNYDHAIQTCMKFFNVV